MTLSRRFATCLLGAVLPLAGLAQSTNTHPKPLTVARPVAADLRFAALSVFGDSATVTLVLPPGVAWGSAS
ncbi:MAG TPA: hypothetical protein VK195_14050 [Burkholderiaceae bacterium]|nr:hypothetical protein [Burkholderiaceae bacterium]